MTKTKGSRNCLNCSQKAHFVSDCRQGKLNSDNTYLRNTGKAACACIWWRKMGQIAKDCKSDQIDDNYDGWMTVMMDSAWAFMKTRSEWKSNEVMLGFACTCNTSNFRSHSIPVHHALVLSRWGITISWSPKDWGRPELKQGYMERNIWWSFMI